MIDHLGVSVADIAKSRNFYAIALAPLGFAVTKDFGVATGFGVKEGYGKSVDLGGEFWIAGGTAQTPRVHIAFSAENRAVVDAFYQAAIAAGGRDNGGPGLRPQYHPDYYAAFVLDPDGHNIEAVCHKAM
jgi:catechol 2,3-dioxygenase-like lactoylglutathione lyase family enzyme